tara:strand:+ start:3591 stop:3929 length:339 start_codon:yes stop_codon:yes gene_type:complete
MYQAVELLIPLAGMAMVFGIVYVSVTAENRKNLAMIEAGLNPNEKKEESKGNLKKGLLLFFIPIGYFVGRTLEFLGGGSNMRGILSAVLFGGLALLIFYFLNPEPKDKELNS